MGWTSRGNSTVSSRSIWSLDNRARTGWEFRDSGITAYQRSSRTVLPSSFKLSEASPFSLDGHGGEFHWQTQLATYPVHYPQNSSLRAIVPKTPPVCTKTGTAQQPDISLPHHVHIPRHRLARISRKGA